MKPITTKKRMMKWVTQAVTMIKKKSDIDKRGEETALAVVRSFARAEIEAMSIGLDTLSTLPVWKPFVVFVLASIKKQPAYREMMNAADVRV